MNRPGTALQAVVLAGGRATRLGRLATTVPKVLQPVGGRPFLHHLLEPLVRSGLRRFHFCLGHLAEPVVRHLRELPETLEVTFQVETVPRGTGGALRAALPHLDDRFLLLLGDTHLPLDYSSAATWCGPDQEGAMLVTSAHTGVAPNTAVTGDLVTWYGKTAGHAGRPPGQTPAWTDTGVCVLRRSALRHVSALPDPMDLGSLFQALIRRGTLAARRTDVPFTDIGTPERYARFRDRYGTPEASTSPLDDIHKTAK